MAIVVLAVLLCTAYADATHKHHLKFPKPEYVEQYPKEACTDENTNLRNQIIENSKCGKPKDVFVNLSVPASLQVNPSAVWVKRCVGLCDYHAVDSKCMATKIKIVHIPVRIYDSKINKEVCSTYPVEVHESCSCCALSSDRCAAPKVVNLRKCSCQCPNMEERRSCLTKRNHNMRWNRSKCACEAKRRTTW